MTSLVLLQRVRPDSVYIACGDGQELVDRLCQDMPVDSIVEIAAEFPQMSHAIAQAKNALKGAPCQDGWYDVPTGVALQQLGVCFGSTSTKDLSKKPIVTKLNKDDRELIQAALQEAKAAGKEAIWQKDLKILLVSTVDAIAEMRRETQRELMVLRESIQKMSVQSVRDMGPTQSEFKELQEHVRILQQHMHGKNEAVAAIEADISRQESLTTAGPQQNEFTSQEPQELCNQQLATEPEHEEMSPESQEPHQKEEIRDQSTLPNNMAKEQVTAGKQNEELPPTAKEEEVEEELPKQPSQEYELPATEATHEITTSTEKNIVMAMLAQKQQIEPKRTQQDNDLMPARAKEGVVATSSRQEAKLAVAATEAQHDTADRAQIAANLHRTFSQLGCKRPPEELYDDLSNMSSICGDESPPHKRLKQYVAARNAARSLDAEDAREEQQLQTPALPTEARNIEVADNMQLVSCARQEADTATSIRQHLRQELGQSAAAAMLSQYQEKVLRDHHGKCQRYLVNAAGATMRLALPKNVAP